MKRFLARLGVYSIPFLIAVLLFFMFEPYNYLRLRGDAPYSSMPLSSMRELMADQPSHIILGDSKMANLNTDYVEQLTGIDYRMLGFGGASVGECVELFWFATEHTDLEVVYFGLGFYTSRGQYNTGRIDEMEQRAVNPFRFMSDFKYWLEAINGVKEAGFKLLGRPVEPPEDPTSFDYIQPPQEMGTRYRLDLERYALDNIYPMCAPVKDEFIDPATLAALDEVIDYCDQNGIELTFVFTPTHASLYTLVLEPLGLGGVTDTLKNHVLGRANVLDMEFENDFTTNDDNFYDGFHLVGPNKQLLADLLFTDTPSDYIVRHFI